MRTSFFHRAGLNIGRPSRTPAPQHATGFSLPFRGKAMEHNRPERECDLSDDCRHLSAAETKFGADALTAAGTQLTSQRTQLGLSV